MDLKATIELAPLTVKYYYLTRGFHIILEKYRIGDCFSNELAIYRMNEKRTFI
jgi:hypothetical protein